MLVFEHCPLRRGELLYIHCAAPLRRGPSNLVRVNTFAFTSGSRERTRPMRARVGAEAWAGLSGTYTPPTSQTHAERRSDETNSMANDNATTDDS